jgi:hypothetical protein
MTLPLPFQYPSEPHERRHGPNGYANYPEYKPWLRDEFSFRCVYCLEREMWYPNRASSFSVDHIEPRSKDPSRICDYENLLYSCVRCNSLKRERRILNPIVVAFDKHLRVTVDGSIEALSTEGQDVIDLLHLNKHPATDNRRTYLSLLDLKRQYPDDASVNHLFLQSFGFPEELPDLAGLRPPEGNSRTSGVENCHFALRARDAVAEVY